MAKTKISEFSSTPGNNTEIDNINISEGCAPSGINDAIRELMAQLKDFQAGTAGDSFNGPVGTTTAAAGAFTTLTASSTATLNTLASSGATLTGGTINGMAIGGTTAAAVSATTLTTSSTVTHNGGTANGVAYLNGSKVLTTGSALTFDGSQLDIPAGTAAAPSLSTIADANTGIFFPAADTIAFAEGGAEAMRINSSGNVGIGTDSPTVRLQVSSATASQIYATDTTSGNTAQMFASSAGAVFGSFTNADVQIRTNNTERLRITAAGNVGIGTSSPSAKLSVQNPNIGDTGISLQRTGSARFDIVTGVAAVTGDALQINDSAANNYLTLRSGNVGIGTSSPSTRLHAKGSGGTIATFERDASGTIAYFNRNAGSGNAGAIIGADSVAGYFAGGNSTSNMVYLDSVNNLAQFFTNGSERARIDSSGTLLVGTTSTSPSTGGFAIKYNGGVSFIDTSHSSGTGSGQYYAAYTYAGTVVGTITQNGTTGVLYNLTSDYRLKNNAVALTGAKSFVMALQPKTWDWWDGSGKGVGFIAHEFMEVAKYSGNGEKDAVDADGKPVYQSIQPSSSEVMANLVALIQEQQNTIDQLKARLDAANL